VAAFFGKARASAGETFRPGQPGSARPALRPSRMPTDRLLWACDCNFVRGEDSFVRAQWAAKPFVWHIYPRRTSPPEKNAGLYETVYCAELPMDAAAELRAFWEAWNHGHGAGEAWQGFWRHRVTLEGHARRWADRLLQHGDLALI